jgi:hypothetical protein
VIEDAGLHAFVPERLPEEGGIPLLSDAVSGAKYDDVARPVAPISRTGGKKDKEEHGTQAPDAHRFILTFYWSSFQPDLRWRQFSDNRNTDLPGPWCPVLKRRFSYVCCGSLNSKMG